MQLSRRAALGAAAAVPVLGGARPAAAQAQQPTIRIGVLTDMSGPYRDISGPGCVVAARQAAQDFAAPTASTWRSCRRTTRTRPMSA